MKTWIVAFAFEKTCKQRRMSRDDGLFHQSFMKIFCRQEIDDLIEIALRRTLAKQRIRGFVGLRRREMLEHHSEKLFCRKLAHT